MLVVRRVEVRDVHRRHRRRQRVGIFARCHTRARNEQRHAQLHRVQRPRRPLLEVRHLQPGGRVHPICRFEQRGQQDRALHSIIGDSLDLFANRIDAPPVTRREEARVHTKRLREISIAPRQRVQVADLRRRQWPAMLVAVSLDVRDRQHLGVRREIVRPNLEVRALQRLRHTRRPGEHITAAAGTGALANRLRIREDPRHQRTLRPDVFDHERTMRERSSAISSRRRIFPDGDFGIFAMNSTDRTFLNDATAPATYSMSSSQVTSWRMTTNALGISPASASAIGMTAQSATAACVSKIPSSSAGAT